MASLILPLPSHSSVAAFLDSGPWTADDQDDYKKEESKDDEVTAKSLWKVPPFVDWWAPLV